MPRPATGSLVRSVAKDGVSVSWSIRWTFAGVRYRETLGREPEWTEQRAKGALERRKAEIITGLWTPPRDEPEALPLALAGDAPTFQVLASVWHERRRAELAPRSGEYHEWALTVHLLPYFGDLRPREITLAEINTYIAAKLAERERRSAAVVKWEAAPRSRRGRRPSAGLSNRSLEQVLKVAAQVMDDAVDQGMIEANPFRARRKRLAMAKPRRSWLERDEADALLRAAGDDRALIGVMLLGGLRVGEAIALRWRSVDLARGRLTVEAGKTAAASRTIGMSADLRDELATYKARQRHTMPDGLVFCSSAGRPLHRSNISNRVLRRAVDRANAALEAAGHPAMSGVTCHSLRRTFASLAYAGGANPAEVQAALGHTDPALALAIYAKVMTRKGGIGGYISTALTDPALATAE